VSQFIFTVTAGRTGTAWLATLIAQNLKIPAVHESIDIDDFGVRMPDIRTMRTFNNRGLTNYVRAFFDRKFTALAGIPLYAETNHTLAKCGLVEYLAERRSDDRVVFMCLRRNWINQCLSYIARSDFAHLTDTWQWYLHHEYRHVIVDPDGFRHLGGPGQFIWYIAEMEARQAYYQQLYGERFSFVRGNLEEVTTPDGAARLLSLLGWKQEAPAIVPPRINANDIPIEPAIKAEVTEAVAQVAFDADAEARAFIASGRRLADTEPWRPLRRRAS
jgi:hypothetical protein